MASEPTPQEKRMSMRRAVFLALVLTLLTAPTWLYPYYARYDSGAYIMGTAGLAGGEAPRILSHPLRPPAVYPPVTMVLLTPVYALSGGSDVAMRFMLALLWLATMVLLAWSWLEDEQRRRWLPWVLLLAGVSSIWLYVGRIQSEIPYLLVTVAAICCLDRLKRDRRFFGGPWGPAVLALVVLAGLTRQIGLMLAVGGALYLVWDRARLRRGIALAALVLLVGAAPGVALYSATQPGQFSPQKSSVMRRHGWEPERGQMSFLSREFAGRVKSNVEVSLQFASGALFAIDFPPRSRAARVALAVLAMLIGVGYLRQWVRGPTAAEFYLLPYLALLLVTPWLVETRFYTVLVPWLALYLLLAIEWLARLLLRNDARARLATRAMAGALFAVALVLVVQYDFVDRWSRNENPEAAAYAWASELTGAEEVVLTRDPFAFHVLTGRLAMSYTASEQKYQPPYRLPGYLAGGGRLDAVLYPLSEEGEVRQRLAEAGLSMQPPQKLQNWVFARIEH